MTNSLDLPLLLVFSHTTLLGSSHLSVMRIIACKNVSRSMP